MKQNIYQENIISALQKISRKVSPQNILIVTMSELLKKWGILRKIKTVFDKRNIVVFDKVKANPQVSMVERGIAFARKYNPDLVIGIGGGSVLDTAKVIALFLNNPGEVLDHLKDKNKIKSQPINLITVPTTAGTGSEATRYAALYYPEGRRIIKKSLEHNFLIPRYAILDPTLLLSLNKFQTAATGLDALSQAIESYWSINSTLRSTKFSKQALEIILQNLEKSVHNLKNINYRRKMLYGAHLAGKAINITETTIVHSVSYPITNYFEVPHGLACALTLPSFLEFNSGITYRDCNDKRGVKFVRNRIRQIIKIIGNKNPKKAKEKLSKLIRSLGLKTQLKNYNIDLDLIVREGFTPERAKNNPRKVTSSDLKKILKAIY